MPDGIDERDDFNLFIGDDDEEDFFSDDENEGGASQKDPYEDILARAKKEAEESVVAALISEDTNSGVYKGLQKVLSKRDRELEDLKRANSELMNAFKAYADSNSGTLTEVEFIKNILPEMLDKDSKQVYDEKRNQFVQSKRTSQLEEQLKQQQMQQRMSYQQNQQQGEDPFSEYKKMAISQMKDMAELYGIDPTDERLDFGDEDNENLVTRLSKFRESLVKVKKEDEELSSVKRKSKPNTKTRGENTSGDIAYGQDLVRRGMAQMIERMREI